VNEIFERCAADPGCAAAYPNVAGKLDALIERLNAEPVVVPVTDPRTGETIEAVLNGDRLSEVLIMVSAQTP
jgi:hypothetical protein